MSRKLDDSEPHQSILHTGSLEEGKGDRWWDDRRRVWMRQAGASYLRGGERLTRLAGASLSTSFREWEGDGVSHDAHKDVNWWQMREHTSLFWYHRGGRYRQIAWCDSCNLLSACTDVRCCHCIDRLVGGSRYLLPAYMRVTNFCYIFDRRNGGWLIRGMAYMRVYTVFNNSRPGPLTSWPQTRYAQTLLKSDNTPRWCIYNTLFFILSCKWRHQQTGVDTSTMYSY